MKSITQIINEALITEAKITYKECPGYSFDWIDIKDKWKSRGEPQHSYSLVVYPDDKKEDIIVFRDFAWYTGGYDQGHASSYKYYLNNIMGGGKGNGGGRAKEIVPASYDLDYEVEDLYKYLTTGKYYSTHGTEKLDKAKMTFDRKTKKSEIKQKIERGW